MSRKSSNHEHHLIQHLDRAHDAIHDEIKEFVLQDKEYAHALLVKVHSQEISDKKLELKTLANIAARADNDIEHITNDGFGEVPISTLRALRHEIRETRKRRKINYQH